MQDITVQELKEKLDQGDEFLFLDVREPWEAEEFNLGAKLIPLADLVNKITELNDYRGEEIVIHCRSGQRSGMAKQLMETYGFTKVRNLTGGVLAWKEAFS